MSNPKNKKMYTFSSSKNRSGTCRTYSGSSSGEKTSKESLLGKREYRNFHNSTETVLHSFQGKPW